MAKRHPLHQRLDAAALRAGLLLFGALPLDAASALGGWLGRTLGPWLAANRVADRNLRRALPNLGDAEVRATLRAMWENLGRLGAEFPHLEELIADEERVQVVDEAGLMAKLREEGRGALAISAHFGNWELCSVPALRSALRFNLFYRAATNPHSDKVIQEIRRPLATGGFLPKGQKGARAAMALLKRGEGIGMLADQKENSGIPVAFFGREAMTSSAPASLAQRFKVPVIAHRVERTGGAHFRITVESIEMVHSGDREADVAANTRRINALFEDWITARPDLWLWAHRRWPD